MKKFIILLSAALILCGCAKENMPADTETSSAVTETTSENTTVPVLETASAEITEITETINTNDDKDSLQEFILEAAKYENKDDLQSYTVVPLMYDDLDGDGKNELIAVFGREYTDSDNKKRVSGELWFASENTAAKFASVKYFYGIDIENLSDIFEIKNIDGHSVIFIKKVSDYREYYYSYLYEIRGGNIRELDMSGKFGEITDLGGGNFSAVKYDRDRTSDNSDTYLTQKNYWFYFENGEFKEYIGEKITKADLMKYNGGKAISDKISEDGGEITNIIYRKNNIININYTVIDDGILYNKFCTVDVSGGTCRETGYASDGEENNYGIYLLSVLDPHIGLPEEQLELYELIEETAGNNTKQCELKCPLFGDFDNDGKNELIAICESSNTDDIFAGYVQGKVWYASENSAECISEDSYFLPPTIVTSMGRTFLKVENCEFTTSSYSQYYLIKNSKIKYRPDLSVGQEVYPDGEYGDFTVIYDKYDSSFEIDSDGNYINSTGHTWNTYWFYSMGELTKNYSGTEISREEFLRYDGAKEILEKIENDGYKTESILKRGNGIININYSDRCDPVTLSDEPNFDDKTESEAFITFRNTVLKYRGGKVYDSGYNSDGYYEADTEALSDFEKFSGMIYDAAEGDENSALLDRFYGDLDSDGKNELYAYYGTPEKFSLWFADENGAEISDKPYELMTIDGDVILKKQDKNGEPCYYIVRKGKSVKLKTFGTKNFTRVENAEFSGYITAKDAVSDSSEETTKEYRFYYSDGKFNQYPAENISEEKFSEYKGARAFLDEISSYGGEVTDIILRENGIININYDAHMQDSVRHYYFTLKIENEEVTDITPRNSDGTLNNSGHYLLKLP